MKRSGTADMALWGGGIPTWLYDRMVLLARPVVESIVLNYGRDHFLSRLSDPFWFQAFGAAIGMDWNSSGVTTATMRDAVAAAKLGANDKDMAIGKLTQLAQRAEKNFTVTDPDFDGLLAKEQRQSLERYGGREGRRGKRGGSKGKRGDAGQLRLF